MIKKCVVMALATGLAWAGSVGAGERSFAGLRVGDWARYAMERDDGTARGDAGIFLIVIGIGDDTLTLTMVNRQAGNAGESEAQLRAMGGRDLYPVVTTPDAVRLAAAAVRDPKDMAEMDAMGIPRKWAEVYLAWVVRAKAEALGDDPDEDEVERFTSMAARRLAERIAPRRGDTEWHIQWRMTERESGVVLDRMAPNLAPFLLAANVVAANAEFEEDAAATTNGTVRIGDRDVACRKRVLDARVSRQGMRTDFHTESWMTKDIPWEVARCRLKVVDLPDETPRHESRILRLVEYGGADTQPAAPYFPDAPADAVE